VDGPILFAHSDLSGLSLFEEASWWGCVAGKYRADAASSCGKPSFSGLLGKTGSAIIPRLPSPAGMPVAQLSSHSLGLVCPCLWELPGANGRSNGLRAEAGQLVNGKGVGCNHLLYFRLLLAVCQDETARATQQQAGKQDAAWRILSANRMLAFQLCLDFLLRAQIVEGNGK
jgi:hypothetical protein